MTKPAKPYQRKYKMEINEQCVPDDSNLGMTNDGVRTPDDHEVCDAYYPHPADKKMAHHLQDAGRDVDMAIWSWGEQGREMAQEDFNDGDILKTGRKRS